MTKKRTKIRVWCHPSGNGGVSIPRLTAATTQFSSFTRSSLMGTLFYFFFTHLLLNSIPRFFIISLKGKIIFAYKNIKCVTEFTILVNFFLEFWNRIKKSLNVRDRRSRVRIKCKGSTRRWGWDPSRELFQWHIKEVFWNIPTFLT